MGYLPSAVGVTAVLLLSTWRVPDGVLAATRLVAPLQNEVRLALLNASSRFTLAVPEFLATPGESGLADHARVVSEVLWNDLDFEREYTLVSRQTAAAIPVSGPDALPFDAWAAAGADLVLTGAARRSASTLTVDIRILWARGANRGRDVFGVRYECGVSTVRGARDCAHRIADDIHKETRALVGVAQTRLAFRSDRDRNKVAGRPDSVAFATELYLSDYDGANAARITTSRSLTLSSAWAPGGGRLAYVSYADGMPDIYVLNLAQPGRAPTRPSRGATTIQNWLPAWSPDGTRLAFVSNRSGNLDIWVVNDDGSNPQNLTNHPSSDNAPTWSPDGSQIAFTSDRAGRNANYLYAMNSVGGGVRPLVRQRIDRPTWSSQNFIAFSIYGEPRDEIGTYDFTTNQVSVLTHEGNNGSPSVSPNGRHIAFDTTRWGGIEVATMDRTGNNVRRVTQGGQNGYPNWEAAARR